MDDKTVQISEDQLNQALKYNYDLGYDEGYEVGFEEGYESATAEQEPDNEM